MADITSLYPEPKARLSEDTDAFNVRLRDINREMQGILEKTSQRRHDLQHWYSTVKAGPIPAAAAASSAPSAGAADGGSASAVPMQVTDELKQWLASQVRTCVESQLPHLLHPLVEQLVGKQLRRFRDTMETMRGVQEDVRLAVDTLSEQWADKQTSFSAAIARAESSTKSSLRHFQSDAEASTRKLLAELNGIRDSVSEMERKYELVEQRMTRRLQDVTQAQQEAVRTSLVEMERQLQEWRGQLDGVVREQAAAMRAERDAVDSHVARMQGTLSSVSSVAASHATDIRVLMDGAVEQKSVVRACRRDVNRLEMMVQSAAAGLLQDGGNGGAAFLEGLRQNADNPSAIMLLVKELGNAREQISFLSGRLEGLERHTHQLDTVLLSVTGGRQSPPRGWYIGEESNAQKHHREERATWSPSVGAPIHRHSAMLPRGAPPYASTPNASALPSHAVAPQRFAQHQHQHQQQQSVWQCYPPGMNHSADVPMNVTVGGSAASGQRPASPSYTQARMAPSEQQQQQEQQQESQHSNFTMFAEAGEGHTAGTAAAPEDAHRRSITATMGAHAVEEAPKSRGSPPQRRGPRTIIDVEEGEDENVSQEAQAVHAPRGVSTAELPRRQPSSHSAPTERLEASRRSMPSSSMRPSLFGDSHVDPTGGAVGEDEESYVGRPASRRGGQTGSGGSPVDTTPHGLMQRQPADQYPPAPTSDSESERENRNLSRMQID